jgi:hypothetical protein
MPRLSAWSIGLHNAHSWALLAVILVAMGTGWGRDNGSEGHTLGQAATPRPGDSESSPDS